MKTIEERVMKTIEERAKEYESNIGSQDYVPIEIEEAFKAGANWMHSTSLAHSDLGRGFLI